MEIEQPEKPSFRRRLFMILDGDQGSWLLDPVGFVVRFFLVIMIICNVMAVVLSTVQPIHHRFEQEFRSFEIISLAVFSIEYLLRLWVCVEHGPFGRAGPFAGRLHYALTPLALIDLIAVVPFLLMPWIGVDLRIIKIFSLIRMFKLARYSPAISSIINVFWEERRALMAALIIMLGLTVITSTLAYLAEREAQPVDFGSIPAAMWWALTTLTTIGYGDVVPITPFGRVIGGLTMLFGVGVFALPVGILANGFAQEIHRRDFVVTFGMLARVPIFHELDAYSLSQIVKLLRSRSVSAGAVIEDREEPAKGMYFIISGQVEIHLRPQAVILREGDFFGEIALLRRTRRSVLITALTDCQLLVLDADAFHRLISENPAIRQHVTDVASGRMEHDWYRDEARVAARHHRGGDDA